MGSKVREKNMKCPCCTACRNCTNFQKILDIKNAGLVIYRHTTATEDIKTTGIKENTTDLKKDVFILHNIKNVEIVSTDFIPAFEQNKLNCPRCRYILNHAQGLLENVQSIDKQDIVGICEHCRLKTRSQSKCYTCNEIVEKYKAATVLQNEKNKRVKIWLNNVQRLLKDGLVDDKKIKSKNHSYSDFDIYKLYEKSHKLQREPEVGQLLLENINKWSPVKQQKQERRITFVDSNLDETVALDGIDQLRSDSQILYDCAIIQALNDNKTQNLNLVNTTSLGYSTENNITIVPDQSCQVTKQTERFDKTERSSFVFKENIKEMFISSTHIKKYRSHETLQSEDMDFTKDFRFVFPKEIDKDKIIQIKSVSTSELIKATKFILDVKEKKNQIKQVSIKRKRNERFNEEEEKIIIQEQTNKNNLVPAKGTKSKYMLETKEKEKDIKREERINRKNNEIEDKQLVKEDKKRLIKEKTKKKHIGTEMLEQKSNQNFKKDVLQNTKNEEIDKKSIIQGVTKKNSNEETINKLGHMEQNITDEKYKQLSARAKEAKPKEIEIRDKKTKHIDKNIERDKNKDSSVETLKIDQKEFKKIDKGTDKIKKQLDYQEQNKNLKQEKEKSKNETQENISEEREATIKTAKLKDREPKDDAMVILKKTLDAELKQKEQDLKLQKQQQENEKKLRNIADQKVKAETKAKLNSMFENKIESNPEDELQKGKKTTKESTTNLSINQVKNKTKSPDDLILELVKMRRTMKNDVKLKVKPSSEQHISSLGIKQKTVHTHEKGDFLICSDSDIELDLGDTNINKDKAEIIVGEKILKYKTKLLKNIKEEDVPPILCNYTFTEEFISEQKPSIHISEETQPHTHAFILATKEGKMNVYRMRPAHPEFDWFEHNKSKRIMQYDTGEKLAEFEDNGRGRWFYRNGRLALDYYDAEELNAQQRFVVYSSGEPDERGRSHPVTILGTFDYLGNGIVFDHAGKIRLKYNQTEGVLLDRSIGPVSHWKWHTLNDPPVLQQVMIDTQMARKDSEILKLGGPSDNKTLPDNEEMLAIEFDNFIKEKGKKLSQKFKPFQIKMKALKINKHFSLRVLDQATVYLLYRDGSTNLKLNIGMVLDHQEIVDTDTAEVGEVSNNLERLLARTDSLAGLQRNVAYAQRLERSRVERERRLRRPEPCASADQLTAAISRPLRPPFRTLPSASTTTIGHCHCKCRKPSSTSLYYDTRLV